MIRLLLKERIFGGNANPAAATLGPLELQLMKILWSRGARNVREVVTQLDRPLAYTTVMTTLDRLYKKGFLDRRMGTPAGGKCCCQMANGPAAVSRVIVLFVSRRRRRA